MRYVWLLLFVEADGILLGKGPHAISQDAAVTAVWPMCDIKQVQNGAKSDWWLGLL